MIEAQPEAMVNICQVKLVNLEEMNHMDYPGTNKIDVSTDQSGRSTHTKDLLGRTLTVRHPDGMWDTG